MKPTQTLFAAVLFVGLLFSQTSKAATYTVTSNGESWSTLVGGTTCGTCTIIIPAGFTLNINGGTCTSCTFSGGSITITSGFTFAGARTVITGSSIAVNAAISFQAASLNDDSIQVNDAITFHNSPDSITDSHIDITDGSSIALQKAIVTNSVFALTGSANMTNSGTFTSSGASYYLDNTANFKISSTSAFSSSTISLSTNSTFTASSTMTFQDGGITTNGTSTFTASSPFTATNSALTFNDNSIFNPHSTMTVSGGSVTLNGSADFTASSTIKLTGAAVALNGSSTMETSSTVDIESTTLNLNGNSSLSTNSTVTIGTGSDVTIGDGSSADTAFLKGGTVNISGGSLVGIAPSNNYLTATTVNGIPSFSIGSNTLSCNSGATSGFPQACKAKFVYGCATLNSGGGVACVTLAIADLNLTATTAGPGTVALAWSDAENTTADHYLVERNTGNNDWTTLATVAAGGYTAGDYHYEDAAAPAGSDDYRIARVDQNGKILYSKISSVTSAGALRMTADIYPNPVAGSSFFLAVPSTDAVTVRGFSLAGQLLFLASLEGQTVYQVSLPSTVPHNSLIIVQVTGRNGNQPIKLLRQ